MLYALAASTLYILCSDYPWNDDTFTDTFILSYSTCWFFSGDLRGEYDVLLHIFNLGGHPSENKYLFLGNYVDLGRNSIDVVALLLSYKIKYPNNIYLLRGNHDGKDWSRVYGLYDECKQQKTGLIAQ